MARLLALAFISLCFSSIGQTNEGLVAKYTFSDGKIHDETGNNAIKTTDGALSKDRFGNSESAYFLYGNSYSYLNLGTSSILKPSNGTISMWFKIDKPMLKGKGLNVNPIIITKSREGNSFYEGYFLGYDYTSKKLTGALTLDSLSQISWNSSDTISLLEWHHVVLAYDDQHLWFYLDGKMFNNERPMTKNFKSKFLNGDSVLIGNMGNKINDRFFCGSIDDIYIYNRILSEKEISALYNASDPNWFHRYLNLLYWILLVLAGLTILTWIFIKRYKKELEAQKETNRINARLNEFETRAIRTQMNPHFIFNSLNTLQRFILEEDIKNSQIYLTKFSKLLRKLLESSASESISLKEEIDILKSYIEIESMRFDYSFEYKINSEIESPEKVNVPFMLIQPFVENAIWHGLLPKKGERLLNISFTNLDSNRISCIVEDNGVGREFGNEHQDPIKGKSLAINFINQRLELLQKVTGINCYKKIIDKKDEQQNSLGTIIEIVIPKLN